MSARWLPLTLRDYRRSWLATDALAGLTLAAVALPSQMATARLAGMPVAAGLYAFVAGSVLYALLGPNRHLSVGADSTIAPLLATAAGTIGIAGTAHYDAAMAFVALFVGALLVVVGLLRLGWVADFLSTPVIAGVLSGIAVEIVVRQLPAILGLKGGGTTTIGRLRQVWHEIGHTNGWSLGIALGVLAVIVASHSVDHRLPGALVGLAVSVVVVDAFGLASHHGVAVLGLSLIHISEPTRP